jgi:heterodisulfide reductase subunit A-like polyferredoxin
VKVNILNLQLKKHIMKLNEQLSKLKQTPEWDVIIIGGGASGLGTALDAASRGYKTILVEAVDFAKELLVEVLN